MAHQEGIFPQIFTMYRSIPYFSILRTQISSCANLEILNSPIWKVSIPCESSRCQCDHHGHRGDRSMNLSIVTNERGGGIEEDSRQNGSINGTVRRRFIHLIPNSDRRTLRAGGAGAVLLFVQFSVPVSVPPCEVFLLLGRKYGCYLLDSLVFARFFSALTCK